MEHACPDDRTSSLNSALYGTRERCTPVRVRLPGTAPQVKLELPLAGHSKPRVHFVNAPHPGDDIVGPSGFRGEEHSFDRVSEVVVPLSAARPIGRKLANQSIQVGSFALGQKFLPGFVNREALDLGGDGKLSFLESSWQRVKRRVGFFPLRDKALLGGAKTGDDVSVHWVQPLGSAVDSLVAINGKQSPGARRTSELPGGSRIRQRARWVNALSDELDLGEARGLVGSLLKGRWTPDLTREYANCRGLRVFADARAAGLKFLGGGTTTMVTGEGEAAVARVYAYTYAFHEGKTFRVYPELLAKLAVYASLRKRSPALVLALRTRASDWCKKVGMDIEEVAHVLAPSVAIAYLPTTQEVIGASILEQHPPESLRGGWWTSVA